MTQVSLFLFMCGILLNLKLVLNHGSIFKKQDKETSHFFYNLLFNLWEAVSLSPCNAALLT